MHANRAMLLPLPPPAAPEPPGRNGVVRETLWRRLLHRLRGALTPRARTLTPLEVRLYAEIDELRLALHGRDQTIYNQRVQLAEKEAEIHLKGKEIEHLTEIHERDRLRTKADAAAYAHLTAAALLGRPPGGERI